MVIEATPGNRDLLAGELALGVLDGAERAEALRLMVADRAFALAVERWRDELGALFGDWPAVAPPPELEGRIMAALPGRAAPEAAGDPGRAVRLWRAVAGASSLAAAAALAALVLRPGAAPTTTPDPVTRAAVPSPAPLVASLTPTGDGSAPAAAVADRAAGEIRLSRALRVPDGRSAELWTIRGTGSPESLGVVASGASRLPVPPNKRARLRPGVVLAVSIEPAGGSRTGSPTGPVVLTGALVGA